MANEKHTDRIALARSDAFRRRKAYAARGGYRQASDLLPKLGDILRPVAALTILWSCIGEGILFGRKFGVLMGIFCGVGVLVVTAATWVIASRLLASDIRLTRVFGLVVLLGIIAFAVMVTVLLF